MLNNFLKRLMTAICLLIFLHIEATWLLKFSRSSLCTLSNLQVVEGSIKVPSTERLIFSSSVWLCSEFVLLKINDLHFSGFSRRPLSVIQLETTANSEFRVFCTILAFALLKYSCLSSASTDILAFLMLYNRSFMQTLNQCGPSTDPWGIPDVSFPVVERVLCNSGASAREARQRSTMGKKNW